MPVRKQLVTPQKKGNPTARNTWKQAERNVATDFACRRTPLSGQNSGHNTSSDTLHDDLYIEVKYRQKFSVVTLYEDTAAKAKVERKLPVVAIKQKGMKGYLLLISPKHLKQLAEFYAAK